MAKSVAKPAETIGEDKKKATVAAENSQVIENQQTPDHVKDETEISIEKKLFALYSIKQND